jgi:hypothetical protein
MERFLNLGHCLREGKLLQKTPETGANPPVPGIPQTNAMASKNRGQPPACQQKVVHRTQVHKGKGKSSKSGHGGNDGWQSKPSGSCQPEEPAKAASVRRKEMRMATWNVTGARNREVELEDAMKAYKIGVLGLSETWLKRGKS